MDKIENAGELDRFDRRIIDCLLKDARIPIVALAEKIGLSKSPTQVRLRRLEENGIVRGYTALIDHGKLNQGHIAFVQVSLSNTRTRALDEFNQAVRRTSEITECHMIAASFDYLLKIRSENIVDYRRILGETISALPHVSHTSTFVAMEAIKE